MQEPDEFCLSIEQMVQLSNLLGVVIDDLDRLHPGGPGLALAFIGSLVASVAARCDVPETEVIELLYDNADERAAEDARERAHVDDQGIG